MKQTNLSQRFYKPDFNFQEVYIHSQSSIHIRIQSEIIHNSHQNCLKLCFCSTSRNLPNAKTTIKLQNRI